MSHREVPDITGSGQAFTNGFRDAQGTVDLRKVLAASEFPVYCIQHRAFKLRSFGFSHFWEKDAPRRIDGIRFEYVAPDLFNVEKDVLVANSLGALDSPTAYRTGLRRSFSNLREMVRRDWAPSAAVFPDNLGALSEYWYHGEHGLSNEATQYLFDTPRRQVEIVGLSFNWLGWNEPAPFVLAQHGADQSTLVIGAVGVADTVMLDVITSLVRVDNNRELVNKLHADVESAREAFRAKYSPHNG